MEKYINIDENQHQNLCKELARLVCQFKKDEDIKCIYFGCYKGLGSISGNVLELTLVIDKINDQLENEIRKMNDKIYQQENIITKLGVRVYIDLDNSNKYIPVPLNPSCVKSTNSLFNSIILYDRDGNFFRLMEKKNEFYKTQDQCRKVFFVYENAAELIPTIDESLVEKNIGRGQLKKQKYRYGSHK